MKGREKTLLIATLTVVGLALAYNFFLGDFIEKATAGGSGTLRASQQKFKDNTKTLKDPEKIREKYASIAFSVPEDQGRDPGGTFSDQLDRLLRTTLNVPAPHLSPPVRNIIPNVDEYYFVDIQADIDGTYEELSRLLQEMERLGLLIKSFTWQSMGGGYNQRDQLKLQVTVARMVKHDELSRRKMRPLYNKQTR